MDKLWVVQYAWLIPLMPLLGAAVAGLFGAKWLKGNSHWPIWIGVGISALLSLVLLFSVMGKTGHEAGEKADGDIGPAATNVVMFNWIEAGDPKLASTAGHPQTVEHNPKAYFLAQAGFFIDPLTSVMLCVICCIGLLITIFAAGYMKGEEGYFRFFAYLGLFIFMMTCLVMGNNLIMLYLGWEGVGLSSYLLIGYYYDKPAAREAAKKAFLVNRVGDFGFGLGIMLCFLVFGTVTYFGNGAGTADGLLQLAHNDPQNWALRIIPFCLMLGAFGKSAQFPLYVWLPDAMEGPTPVSALIHAATMVTAGVYMIVRCGTLFVNMPDAMTTIAVIGCFTAALAATIALRQFDLKKVFAYSTISQLGFMFVAVGVIAPVAGVFHLITHAFFKALLFLSSGVVMHAMSGELDMRKMSGLRKVLPKTHILMGIGCLALAAMPPFSGFFSKDDIVSAAFERDTMLGVALLVVAFMTAYYTARLYFRVFWGPVVIPVGPPAHGHGHEDHAENTASQSAIDTGTAASSGVDVGQANKGKGKKKNKNKTKDQQKEIVQPAPLVVAAPAHGHDDHGHHDHEPPLMIIPLVILAAGALLAGFLNWPSEFLGRFLENSPSIDLIKGNWNHAATAGPNYPLMILSALISGAGIFVAYWIHLRNRPLADRLAHTFRPVVSLIDHKFYVDEIYQALIVEPLRSLGKGLAFIFDKFFVDGLVNLAGMIPQGAGLFLRVTIQRGYLQGYAAAMLFGIAIILLVIFVH